MAYFLSQSVRNLLAKAIGLKFSSSFCHRVAPSPVLHAAVIKLSFLDQSVLSMVLPLFLFLIVQNRPLFLLSIPILCLFSAVFSFCLFFWIDCSKILMCCIEPRNDFSSLVFVGAFNFVIASVLSLIGFTPFWFISYPNQVSSFLNSSFFSRSLGNRFLVVLTVFRVILLRVLLMFRW